MRLSRSLIIRVISSTLPLPLDPARCGGRGGERVALDRGMLNDEMSAERENWRRRSSFGVGSRGGDGWWRYGRD
jgi:hypothetical protein